MAIKESTATERRVPLNRERVLAAAVELADREGIDALSMRRLGQELSVEAMALYNHVANKDDLLNGMVDAVVGEIELIDAEGTNWGGSPTADPVGATRHAEPSVGLCRNRLTHGGESGRHALHGPHRRDLAGRRLLPRPYASRLPHPRQPGVGFTQELFDDSSSASMTPKVQELMIRQMSQEYPNVTAILKQVAHDEASVVGTGCDDQFEFEFAIDVILDGLEALRQREATAT